MKSLRELYKIGYGPSSSHTMGPQKACVLFRRAHPDAVRFKVTLYGSLALTGRGHLTDVVIQETLQDVEVRFDPSYILAHPNTLDIVGIAQDDSEYRWRVYSVGGGSIKIEGDDDDVTPDVYPHHTFEAIKAYCKDQGLRLHEYVERFEGPDIWNYLAHVYKTMNDCVTRGLKAEGTLPGELGISRKAKMLLSGVLPHEPQDITESRTVSAYAYAVSEENASGHTVVTAPTCGSCGVVPAVMRYLKNRRRLTVKKCLEGLATAGIVGNLIKHNASISGAIAGCQAEVGAAVAMAAALAAEFDGLSLNAIDYAAEVSLEHHLGLTCDPVLGYVQIPCIERNAVGALRAIDACGLAYFLAESHRITLDMVIETMYQTGKDIHHKYRETAIGGLAEEYLKQFRKGKEGE
ncbi:MAG TPA: serine dehydratase [Acholeplasmatales bacterium]|nr:serine dehydratase [Acholeplasmatales bacterium]